MRDLWKWWQEADQGREVGNVDAGDRKGMRTENGLERTRAGQTGWGRNGWRLTEKSRWKEEREKR